MSFTIATWNINSVRLRLPLVLAFLEQAKPDILCLQETKCPNNLFPLKAFEEAGYPYAAINGQKGYHGVATLSRLPFFAQESKIFCEKNDCRHVEVVIKKQGLDIKIHNVYAPAGGNEPDPETNDKFAHKLQFIDELANIHADNSDNQSSILVGDLNIAPLENDVWSHKQMLKVISHTPVETEGLIRAQQAGNWHDVLRAKIPASEKLYTWWSYRARDWALSNRGRRLDHIWASSNLMPYLETIAIIQDARGWERPSDHVPVLANFDLD